MAEELTSNDGKETTSELLELAQTGWHTLLDKEIWPRIEAIVKEAEDCIVQLRNCNAQRIMEPDTVTASIEQLHQKIDPLSDEVEWLSRGNKRSGGLFRKGGIAHDTAGPFGPIAIGKICHELNNLKLGVFTFLRSLDELEPNSDAFDTKLSKWLAEDKLQRAGLEKGYLYGLCGEIISNESDRGYGRFEEDFEYIEKQLRIASMDLAAAVHGVDNRNIGFQLHIEKNDLKNYSKLPFMHMLVDCLKTMMKNAVEAIGKPTEQSRIACRMSTTTKDKIYLRVELKDDGPGMPAHVRDAINAGESPGSNPGKAKSDGMGLIITRAVVCDLMHGSMQVESEEGQGTKFIIDIPFEGTERFVMPDIDYDIQIPRSWLRTQLSTLLGSDTWIGKIVSHIRSWFRIL